MTKITQTVQIEIEQNSSFDQLVSFLRSKSGHGAIILVSCLVLSILTTFLFGDTLENIRGWQLMGLIIGVLFAFSFELSVFFCAINGYTKSSYFFALMSLLVARGTFEKFSQFELSFMYLSTWIMCVAPVLIVLIASHKLADRYKLEALAKAQLEKEEKENQSKHFTFTKSFTESPKLNGQSPNGQPVKN